MTHIPRHDLDETIDRVAAKMVAIDQDASTMQIALERLPDRKASPGFLRLPTPATAAVALLLAAFMWAKPGEPPATPIGVAPTAVTTPPSVSRRTLGPVSRQPDGHVPAPVFVQATAGTSGSRLPTPDSRLGDDHERSLAPVAPIKAIALTEIAAPAIELAAPALLEPLVLTDLSLEIKGDS